MKITWNGHACFSIETTEGTLVLDPYEPESIPGLRLPALEADEVVCSHEHYDHNAREAVKRSGQPVHFALRQLDSWHDEQQGAKRGANKITILDAEGLRLVHLGDLGHRLSGKQVAQLGAVDVLLIPVGGYYTIDAATAWAVAQDIQPRILIPMHYRGEGFGFKEIAPVEDFLRLADKVQMLADNTLDPAQLETPVTAVLRCPTAS